LVKRKSTNCIIQFGGCIRGWPAQGEVWAELEAKIKELAQTHGDNILAKHTSNRGSIVHSAVDFDESRPIIECRETAAKMNDGVLAGGVNKHHNDFSKYHYIFGSTGFWKE